MAPRLLGWGAARSRIVPLLLFAAAWQGLSSAGLVDQDLLPSPWQIGKAFADMLGNGELVSNLGVTLRSTFVGLSIGALCGIAIGMAMAVSKVLNSFFGPLVRACYTLPKPALVPLLILWFGIGTTTNTITVVLASLLPVIVYTYNGMRSVPKILVWGALSLGTPASAVFLKVALPAATRSILVGVRIALGYSFVLAIAAEMIASNAGIGKLIFGYGESGSYDYMFAAVAVIVLVAFLSDRLLVRLSDWWLRWEESEHRSQA